MLVSLEPPEKLLTKLKSSIFQVAFIMAKPEFVDQQLLKYHWLMLLACPPHWKLSALASIYSKNAFNKNGLKKRTLRHPNFD